MNERLERGGKGREGDIGSKCSIGGLLPSSVSLSASRQGLHAVHEAKESGMWSADPCISSIRL
jgi:hypothetical protein